MYIYIYMQSLIPAAQTSTSPHRLRSDQRGIEKMGTMMELVMIHELCEVAKFGAAFVCIQDGVVCLCLKQ